MSNPGGDGDSNLRLSTVFVAIPTYRQWNIDAEVVVSPQGDAKLVKKTAVRRNLIQMEYWHKYARRPKATFQIFQKDGGNTVFLTNRLAELFDEKMTDYEWFLLSAADQTIEPEDVERMIACAERFGAQVIGGLTTLREPHWEGNRPNLVVAGNWNPDGGSRAGLDLWRRGIEITDQDVRVGRCKPVDAFGGGGLYHRSVIEALRPDRNNGLNYFTYDKQYPGYDLRVFERIKEKGFKILLHCGTVVGHWGFDEKGKEFCWNFWNSPDCKIEEASRPNRALGCEVFEESWYEKNIEPTVNRIKGLVA